METSLLTTNSIIGFTVSNLLALFVAITAGKHVKIARAMLSLIFALAGMVNVFLACTIPTVYLTFADTAIAPYQRFINGPFVDHIQPMVAAIAMGQWMVAGAIWCKGILHSIGCLGGAAFCLAIAPLGYGAAFPSTLILAFAFLRLHTKSRYITHH